MRTTTTSTLDDLRIGQSIDRLLDLANGTSRHEIRRRPQPVPPHIQARLDKMHAFEDEQKRIAAARKRRDLDRRAQAILGDYNPKPLSEIDIKIEAQLSKQPEKHRKRLAVLYRTWCADNALYFQNRLNLPIIAVADLSARNALAECHVRETPCLIRFDEAYFESATIDALQGTLIHEAIHQAIAQHDGGGAAVRAWHNQEFADICNRIGRMRGWPDCYVKHDDWKRQSQHWPKSATWQ